MGGIDDLLDYTKDYCKNSPKNKTAKDFQVFIKKNRDFLRLLQEIHDENGIDDEFELSELKSNLINVAKRYKLNYNHLKELTKEYK